MIMIAFITINSNSLPLTEGLCAQIFDFRYELISGLRSHLLLFLSGRKNILKEKAFSPRFHPASSHIHTHVYLIHMYEYIYAEIFHLDSSGPLGVSSRLLGSQPSTPSVHCVCVCAYTHTYTHIHPHPREKIETTQTTLLSFLLSKIFPHDKQQVLS